jgi:phage/plasmid primase-like uncharacterized protein
VRAGQWLLVAEGLETTFSVMHACALPRWAALSAGGIKTLVLPTSANMVVICADNDANGVGQRAANAAAERSAFTPAAQAALPEPAPKSAARCFPKRIWEMPAYITGSEVAVDGGRTQL